MSTTILIVDDHESIRDGLRFALKRTQDLVVIEDEGRDGEEAVELIGKHNPDIVLMDVRMPKKTGVEATIEVMKEKPNQAILLFTAFSSQDEPGILQDALHAGCRGYILKTASGAEIVNAIRTVLGGGIYIDPALAFELVAETPEQVSLTNRETQVLTHLSQGETLKEIALQLFIGYDTARDHCRNACRKLNASNKTHAVALAIQLGLVAPPS